MKSTGIVRKVDQLGRFVLPSELRNSLGIKDDALEVFTSGDMIVLKKYAPSDIFTGDMEDLIEYKGKRVSKKTIKELCRIAGFKIVEEVTAKANDEFEIDIDL
jgi:hypothetical protein